MSRFRPIDRLSGYLLPPTLDEWLPDDHLARFVVEVVDQLDLTQIENSYGLRGSSAYHPSLLTSLLVYGYATGVFSSRKIERATYDSVAFRFISAGAHPDHDTIAAFRARFLAQLNDLFVQVLAIAHEMKLLKLGTISLDGTKIKANASAHHALSHGHIEKLQTQLQNEVTHLFEQAELADQSHLSDDLDIPAEIKRREDRLEVMAQAKATIEQRAKVRDEQAKEIHQEKLKERAHKEQQTGKKLRGRAPKPPEEGPQPKDQINLTDEQSRIMPLSGGGFEQAYNAQAAVDATSLIVLTHSVTQDTNDKRQVEPCIEQIKALPKSLGTVDTLLADSGYYSENNVKAVQANQIRPLIATGRQAHHVDPIERLAEPEKLEENASIKQTMQHTLKTQAARKLYALRKQTIEPVFGIIKSVMGFRTFSLRGLEAVKGEWSLVCLAWNIKRMGSLRLK